jgi:diguanylate cyclase (GGDEF)-like protein
MVALGLATALVGAVGVYLVQRQIQARVMQSAELTARVIVSLVVSRNVTGEDIVDLHLDDDERADMNADLGELHHKQDVVALRFWVSGSGTLLYDGAGTVDGLPRVTAARLAQARHGALARNVEVAGQPALDVYIPYSLDDGRTVPAVVEVILPGATANSFIARWTATLYGIVAGLALLAGLAVRAARRRHGREEYAARHDTLTGLGNRLLLAEAVHEPLAAMTADRGVALLLLDLDGFKEINDTLGHDAGDQLLQTVAQRLAGTCADARAHIRLGGDEFVVMYENLPTTDGTPDAAIAIAERIRNALREPLIVSDLIVEVDASVGIALGPLHGTDLTSLLKGADVAMYQAKRGGYGISVYDPLISSQEAAQLTVLAELRLAISLDELRLFYQPKSGPDGRITEVEALVRWQHPRRGLLAPDEFLPLAERTSIIKPLTAWVLTEAARQYAQWRAEGRDLQIAVNVSARNLVDDDLIDALKRATRAAGIPVDALQVEITETAMMIDPARASAVLAELRRMRVHVSIDDFGVGYTSLSYLSTLPAQALKIDQRFITNLMDSPVDEILVRNVIQLARDLGLTSVAEGVETQDVWQRVTDLGCDEIQGYLLTRPLPPEQFIAWLDTWTPEAPARLLADDGMRRH